jgi:DNA modification methylase
MGFYKLFNGDCLQLLSEVPSNSVDLLLTDPPYNVSRETHFGEMNGHRQGMDFGEWDKDFDITGFIKHLPRVLKQNSNVVIFNAWENLGDIARVCEENHIHIKRCLVLNKANPAPFNRDRMFVNDVEFAVWGVYASDDKPTKWTFNRQNSLEKCVIDTTVQNSDLHPTMKDIKVIKYLVELLSNKEDTVLDCFMGSGTTGEASILLGRNFYGIELSEKYFKICEERIKASSIEFNSTLW